MEYNIGIIFIIKIMRQLGIIHNIEEIIKKYLKSGTTYGSINMIDLVPATNIN